MMTTLGLRHGRGAGVSVMGGLPCDAVLCHGPRPDAPPLPELAQPMVEWFVPKTVITECDRAINWRCDSRIHTLQLQPDRLP
jgi:hypothetical protein